MVQYYRAMRKKLSILLLLILSLSITSANAEDSFWADDSSPQGQIGLVWYEDVLRSGNGISYVSANDSAHSWALCNSLNDPACADFRTKTAELMLPVCSEGEYEFCVEGLSVGIGNSPLVKGKFNRSIQGNHVPANTKLNVPAGSTTGLWKVPGINHSGGTEDYAVGARLRYFYTNGQLAIYSFEASIVPYRVQTGSSYSLMKMKLMDNYSTKVLVHDWHVGNCIWQEPDLCGVATQWTKNSVASLSLKLPNQVTGWLQGRLQEPTIAVTKLSNRANHITVTAKPVTVQGSAPKANVDNLSPSLIKVITRDGRDKLRSDSGYVWQLEPTIDRLDWFEAWQPLTKDKADGLSDYWNFKSLPGNFLATIEQRCLYSTEKLVGLVTTNSLLYSGKPPTFKDSQLNYQVASLHFNPDGVTPFLGTYDLVIDADAARCLYGYSSAPVQATVNVISANGENQVAVTNLSERGGWLGLSVKGFTFSSPTIKIKLSQERTNSIQRKGQTITCTRGKTVKKITGTKPVCPSGFKKS